MYRELFHLLKEGAVYAQSKNICNSGQLRLVRDPLTRRELPKATGLSKFKDNRGLSETVESRSSEDRFS
jgi:hypothetical protein